MANAMRFQGSILRISTAQGANISITGVTKANPGVFTSAAAHGLAVNDIVYVGAITGMPEFQPGHYVVNTAPSGTTFTLRAATGPLDTTSYATAGTTATANRMTMTQVCEIRSINSQNTATPEIDTTGICDESTTFVAGLKSLGTLSLSGNYLPQATVQAKLREYELSGTTFAVEITFPSPAVNGRYVVPAFMQNINFSGQVNDKWMVEMSLKKAGPEIIYIPA